MFSKIKKILKSIILKYFCSFLIKLNNPYLILIFLKLVIKKSGNGDKTFLSFGRPIFNEDIIALSKSSKYSFYTIDKFFIMQIQKNFISELHNNHQQYYKNIKNINPKKFKNYQLFISNFLDLLKKEFKINYIISSNFNYLWQQEIFIQAKLKKIKRVILYKEGINPLKLNEDKESPHEKLILFYKNKNLEADLILTYNDKVKEAFENSGILNNKKILIKSIGIPRFHNISEKKVINKDGVIYFTFDILEKARQLRLSSKKLQILRNRINSFNFLFSKFVIENKNIPVLIKTKSNIKFLNSAKKNLNKIIDLPNVKFTNQGNSIDLMLDKKLVVGFNSTTLIEAMILKKKIISMDSRNTPIECMFANTKLYKDICPKIDNLDFNNIYTSKKNMNKAFNKEWLETKSKFLGNEIIINFEDSMKQIDK